MQTSVGEQSTVYFVGSHVGPVDPAGVLVAEEEVDGNAVAQIDRQRSGHVVAKTDQTQLMTVREQQQEATGCNRQRTADDQCSTAQFSLMHTTKLGKNRST